MKKTVDQINVKKLLEREDFLTLFTSQLDMTEDEIEKLKNVYYPTYMTFLTHKVPFQEAWVAIRNLFIAQETQIGERQKNGNG